ncbi:MAG TPA: cyclic nucleotide-binding domain-containing protein [Thermoanaerobaculia bacterium]|nr:cyclic nucleotide-binding domain-containing protein [Thermoanaerobaculia bacterium]
MGIENLLERWEIFSHFTEPQLAQLAQCISRRVIPPGTAVVKEGERTHAAYLIQSGGIRIQRKTPYGLFSLALLQPGTLFGETSFVDREPRSGDAVTTSETELFGLDPDALQAIMDKDQRFQLALYWTFWKSLSSKLRQTNQNLTHFFSETGRPPSPDTTAARPTTGEFRVDMASKRKLFQEQKLSNMEINFLTSLSKERKFGPNQVIFREGEMGNEMYVVLEGRVMISKYIPGAGEEALAFLERGGYFGEMALIDHEPRSADAKAHEDGAVVLAIPREVVEGILDIHKISSIRLLTILCHLVASRLRELDEKVIGWFIIAGGSGISWPVPQK